MTFSIIVPVYNVEAYLDECLKSLYSQDYKDYEVICVNDGSTDGSRILLSKWGATFPRMKVIDRENGGLSAARNTGLAIATGEYVLFVDSDDWVEITMLSTLVRTIEGEDMVCFACRRTDEALVDTLIPEQSDGWSYYNRNALKSHVVPFVCVWQRCYRREFLIGNNILFREGILHEDNEFIPRACLAARKVKVIPNVLYNYRARPGSIMTTRGLRSKESLIRIANDLSKQFCGIEDINKTVVYQALTQCYQMAFINNTHEEDLNLLPLVDKTAYRRVSRTKMRHVLNRLLILIHPAIFRWFSTK